MVNNLTVVFRVDASIDIGSGHVMRCLSLADSLKTEGAKCHFICRKHTGNLKEMIEIRGYAVHFIGVGVESLTAVGSGNSTYYNWLGTTQDIDAEECLELLRDLTPGWLIVDHYALDIVWEKKLKAIGCKLMVIDDLADRQHASDLLLDQTFGRNASDYLSLVPKHSVLLCGSEYALLRQEFADFRSYSLNRRADYGFETLLITLGGVDKDNVTRRVLEGLKQSELPEACRITVVMGATAPWLEDIRQLASTMPWRTEVKVGVENMAQLMSDSDFAIGAAGSTSWERCCLGLPTAMMVLADNQKFAADLLEQAKAVVCLSVSQELGFQLRRVVGDFACKPELLKAMSECASLIVDGTGSTQVSKAMMNLSAIGG